MKSNGDDFNIYKSYLIDLLVSIDSLLVALSNSLDRVDSECAVEIRSEIIRHMERILEVKNLYKKLNAERNRKSTGKSS
jgi:hypothetical protein